MAFLVTSRVADERSTPRYQSPTRVRNMPKARMAMATPAMVRQVRSLWRNALRMMSFRKNIALRSAFLHAVSSPFSRCLTTCAFPAARGS